MRNGLFHIRRTSPMAGKYSLEDLIYFACLSDITKVTDGGEQLGEFSKGYDLLCAYFKDWSREEIDEALNSLADKGLVMFDDTDEDIIYVGTFDGKRFDPFTPEDSSLVTRAEEKIDLAINEAAVPKVRLLYIKNRIKLLRERGIDNMSVTDFNELHSLLYEIYTGGEDYKIRNKIEYYQINNMLKSYDKRTIFAIVTFGVLDYDTFRKKGVPTITNVAYIKDDVMRRLVHKDTSSKEYMREKSSDENSDNEF